MSASSGEPRADFRHEAFLYAGADDFVARAGPIVAGAVEAGDPVLVAIDQGKIDLLREHLGAVAGAVAWKDIRGIGRNPARIIPVWHQFVRRHGGRGRLWGFGEPIWAGRTPAELVEAQRHEQLLNLAFAGADGFTLICPYDVEALDGAVLHEAHHSHPVVTDADARPSASYPGLDSFSSPFDGSLADAPRSSAELPLDGVPAAGVRRFLADHATPPGTGLDSLTVAIAAVTASMARPRARLRVWREGDATVAEITDLEPVDDPLAGREWPPPDGTTRGLWLANQLCDLVQLRGLGGAGAVVRLSVGRSVD